MTISIEYETTVCELTNEVRDLILTHMCVCAFVCVRACVCVCMCVCVCVKEHTYASHLEVAMCS